MRPSRVPDVPAGRLRRAMVAVGLLAALGAAAGIPVPAAHGAQTTADEPQYLLTAISLAEDHDLDIADELAAGRWRAFHAAPLPEQTRPLASGRRLSPHDPLLPLLLAGPVWLGGWVGAKLAMAVLAGLLAALLLWTAVRRFGVPPGVAALAAGVFALSPPLAVYGNQLYPELPAALAVLAAVAAMTAGVPAGRAAPDEAGQRRPRQQPGRLPRAGAGATAAACPSRRATLAAGAAIAALPWLAVKYVPVAAALALVAVWRLERLGGRRRALALVAGLAAAGIAFLLLHRWWYGGWTPYATGDHFVGGEFTAVGSDPDYLGRSRRLLGLMVDRGFGLAAWQPAWLLAVPALAALARRRPPGWAAPAGPLLAGWLVATFVALTMHGWWFPGRQLVVVLPLAAVAVAWWARPEGSGPHERGRLRPPRAPRRGAPDGPGRRRLVALAVAGGLGVGAFLWLVADGLGGRITWAVDGFAAGYPPYRAWRLLLPDYLRMSWWTWALHAAWLLALGGWAALAWNHAGRAPPPRPRRPPSRLDRAAGPSISSPPTRLRQS
jgi:hypothetical protein